MYKQNTPPSTTRRTLFIAPRGLCAHGITIAGEVLGRLTQAGAHIIHVDSQEAALTLLGDPYVGDVYLVASETEAVHGDITALLERRNQGERLVFTPFSAPQHA